MKKFILFLSITFMCLFSAQAQLTPEPTPKKYAIDSGVPFDDSTVVALGADSFIENKYWERIVFTSPINGMKSIDCHYVLETETQHIACIVFKEIFADGREVYHEKRFIFQKEQVKYISRLR